MNTLIELLGCIVHDYDYAWLNYWINCNYIGGEPRIMHIPSLILATRYVNSRGVKGHGYGHPR